MVDYTPTSTPTDTPDPSDADAALLKEIRDRFDYALEQWEPIRREAAKDVKYVAGNTWDENDKAVRVGRPMLNLDQLGQYINQLVNSFRQNPRAAKISPAGSGATDKTAELRGNRIREIEHASHAQEAYTVAGENAATRSYGFVRLVAEYADSTSARQQLRIKAVPNPDQVLPDPDAESTSGADWSYLFYVHTISHTEFKRTYPGATVKDFTPEIITSVSKSWFPKEQRVQIAEYWAVTETPVPEGRPVRTVCQYVTNGIELLKKPGQLTTKTEWPGSSIPFASCYGKIIYGVNDATGDTEKMLQSYVRLARDAAKYYNWIKSTEGEVLSMVPKANLFAYEGQISPENLELITRSTYEPVPVIFAKAQTEATGTAILPLPQRVLPDAPIQAYEIAAESARRDVQNALGRYSTQDSRLGGTKVTSGVALQELDKSGDLGSYHFLAHYDDMIREVAVKLNELLPFYDDTDSEIPLRLPDGTSKMQRINHPTGVTPTGDPTYAPDDLRMDPAQQHSVAISTGPSFDSQRDKAKDAALTLLGNPQAFPFIAADSMRLLDLGPVGDQMAEDLEFLQPPEMQAARQQQKDQGAGAAPDPKQLQQQLAQLTDRLQQCEQALQEATQAVETKQAEQQARLQIAQGELQSADANAEADRQLKAQQAQGEQALKAEIAAREFALKEAQLALDQAALELKAAELESKERMHAEDLAHEEKIAEMNNAAKVDAAEKAAQVAKTIAAHKDAASATNGDEA